MNDYQEYEIEAGDFYFLVEVRFELEYEPAQHGGMTDPSWPAHWIVDGEYIESVKIWSDKKQEYVKSYNYLFEGRCGTFRDALDDATEGYETPEYDKYWDY